MGCAPPSTLLVATRRMLLSLELCFFLSLFHVDITVGDVLSEHINIHSTYTRTLSFSLSLSGTHTHTHSLSRV